MPTVHLDTVDNSSLILTGNAMQEVYRGFTIEEMDTGVDPSALSASAVSALAAAGIAMGQTHPSYPAALLTRLEIQGLLPNAVSGRLYYSTIQGATPTSYVLTRSTRLVQETSNVLPDGRTIDVSLSQGVSKAPRDFVPMGFLRPTTVLTAEGIRYGAPNYPGADYVGAVNEGSWGGRDTGHWLIVEFETSWSKFEGYHTFRCSVQSGVANRDWSTLGVLRNAMTGKYVIYDGMQDKIQTALALPYEYSADIGTNTNGDGFLRVGGYPTVNFSTIGL